MNQIKAKKEKKRRLIKAASTTANVVKPLCSSHVGDCAGNGNTKGSETDILF